jgi:trimeric autotransporter adhesin
MKKNYFTSGISILLLSLSFTSLNANAAFVTVPCTGFSADVVANGVGNAQNSTDSTFDAAGWYLLDSSYRFTIGGAAPLRALSPSGFISSVATPGLNFQLASFTGANSLRVDVSNSPKSLNFVTPVSASQVYILGATGSGQGIITVTVNFTDATSQSFTSQTLSDWFAGTGFAIQGIGRVNNLNSQPTGTGAALDPRLYQKALTLNAANYTKLISGITVTRTSTVGVINIMAVSIATPPLGISTPISENTASIKIVPNPVIAGFYLDLTNISNANDAQVNVKIYNIIGAQIYATSTAVLSDNKLYINPETPLTKGVYVVETEINNKRSLQKFVVN